MSELVKDLEQEDKFSPYPEQMDKYFLENEIIIKTFPQELSTVSEIEFPDFRVTSAKQYAEYLEQELSFWESQDLSKKLQSIAYYNKLTTAKCEFENAINNVNSPSHLRNYLSYSTSQFQEGVLYSGTKLSQVLLGYIDRTKNFFDGFRAGIVDNKSTSVSSSADHLEGFLAALAYRGTYTQYIAYSEDIIKQFQENAKTASKSYADLNQAYTKAFHNQEERIAQITHQTNEHLTELNQKSTQQYDDANTRLTEMESLYREKLKLEEPAIYWDKLYNDYRRKGTWWLVASGALALLIVGGLITFLLLATDIFSDEYHWFDNFKNSAIITVVASVAIYMLRLTVKMATSSYHLSRDAKERNNLAYFYLALIEKGAVSDKERALILNALFSRSDTGLLKGEAAPSMPTNVSDIIEILKDK